MCFLVVNVNLICWSNISHERKNIDTILKSFRTITVQQIIYNRQLYVLI